MSKECYMDIFPLLCPVDESFRRFAGYVNVGTREFQCEVEFSVCDTDGSGRVHFKCCMELQRMIGSSAVVEQVFRRRLASAAFAAHHKQQRGDPLERPTFSDSQVYAFMNELREILTRLVRDTPATRALPSSSFYERIMAEMDQIGWDRVVNLDTELSSLSFAIVDAANREHVLRVMLDKALYPQVAPKCQMDLPNHVWPGASSQADTRPPKRRKHGPKLQRYDWDPVRSRMKDVIEFYERVVAQFQDFWDVMEDIDSHTWVLEPERPSRASKMRRIAVNTYCSMQIEVDPLKPRAIPVYRFLGAESEVASLIQNLVHAKEWNPRALLRHNLERAMRIEFAARPPEGSHANMDSACGICYTYALDGVIPDKVCDKCHRPFHTSCLSEWLQSDSSTKRSFGVLYGACPYCSHKITVSARISATDSSAVT